MAFDQKWFNREKKEYETPSEIFDPLNEEFKFTLDVAATADNAQCSQYFTESQNGLVQEWKDNICWMNPPFGRTMKQWVKKAFDEWQKDATVVCLLPARTNTAWWHDWAMKGEVRFIRGEVRFKGYDRGLWMPMAIVIFKND